MVNDTQSYAIDHVLDHAISVIYILIRIIMG